MERPLRLIAANPVDSLARTIEALLVVASQPLGRRRARRGGGRRGRAGRDGPGPARRAVSRGSERNRARAGRRRLGIPRLARGGRGLRSALRAARGAEPLPGRARDARRRRVPGPVLAAGDRTLAGRRRRLGGRRARRAGSDRGGGAWRRWSRAVPRDAALRAGVRPREPGRPAAARGSRRATRTSSAAGSKRSPSAVPPSVYSRRSSRMGLIPGGTSPNWSTLSTVNEPR